MTDNEELEDAKPSTLATYWKAQIQAEEKAHQGYRDFGEEAEKAYNSDNKKSNKYNILWSNVQVQMGALYQATGEPEVRRRNKDNNGPQKDAAMMLERAISFNVDSQDFDGNVKRAENDMLVVGMGQARIKYRAETEMQQEEVPVQDEWGQVVGVEVQEYEAIASQLVELEFYSWKNFHWQPSKSWEKVEWVAFDHYKTKKTIRDQYGIEAHETDLDDDGEKSVKCTEIFHKPSRTVIVIADQFEAPIEVRRDELGLQGFFPCPKPMTTNVKSAKFIPVSDYWFYQSQAKQLNVAIQRIDSLVGAVRDVGFYDASFTELSSAASKTDGALVPVDNLLDKLDGSNLENIIAKIPVQQAVGVIGELQQHAEAKKQEIYEILGIADIVRGATKATETLGAQQLKGQYSSVRMSDKQQTVAFFVRDIFRLMGEVIGEHFEPEILEKMTGVEATPEVIGILRNDVMRNFSVDIESDSTLAQDEREEQNQRMEALSTMSNFMQLVLPAMQSGAMPKEVGIEMLLMSLAGFKYTGNLEDIISQMGDQETPEAQIMQMQQVMGEMEQEIGMLQQELSKYDELDQYKAEADIRNKNANTDKTKAETVKTEAEIQEHQIENAANTMSVMSGRGAPYATG